MNGLSTLHRINDAVRSEESVAYINRAKPQDDNIIEQALDILKRRMREPGDTITSPQASTKYFQLKLGEQEREVFAVLFLDTRHRVIAFEELFYGTIDGASVHPREVVKRGLQLNAAAVIIAHNHPSGNAEPSQADIQITKRLKDSLALIEIRVLDHLVVTADESVSLAQRGEL